MSWDVFIQDLPDGIETPRDIPLDFRPAPLGRRREVLERIRSVVPDINFGDERSGWAVVDRDGYSIEVSVGEDSELINSVGLFVRGGDEAVEIVVALVAALGGTALCSGAEDGLFRADRALDSFRRWRAYRDQVVSGAE